jgi:hypothetical protein
VLRKVQFPVKKWCYRVIAEANLCNTRANFAVASCLGWKQAGLISTIMRVSELHPSTILPVGMFKHKPRGGNGSNTTNHAVDHIKDAET